MLIYLIPLITCPLFYLAKNYSAYKHRAEKIGMCLLFMMLSALLTMRAISVGTDTHTMIDIYMSILSQDTTGRTISTIAPVYYIYSYVLYSIFPFPQAILISNGLLTLLCVFHFIGRFSDDKYLSVYLFVSLGFYFMCFNVMRQMFALSIFLVAILFMDSRRYWLGTLMAILSCGVHITAISMFPLLIIFLYKNINNILLPVSICISILFVFWGDTILNYIASVVGYILPSYSMYIHGNSVGFGNEGQGRILWLYIFYIIVVLGIYCMILFSNDLIRNKKARLFMLPVAWGCAIGCIGITNPLLARLSANYLIFGIILIPLSLQYLRYTNRCFLYICILTVTLLPFYISITSNHGDILPYKFFFL